MHRLSVVIHLKNVCSHLHNHGHGFLFTPGTFSSPHLQDYTTNAPDVNLRIIATLSRVHNFRRHPKHGTLHGSKDVLLIDVICPLGDAKVTDLADTGLLNQNIISLEILSYAGSVMQNNLRPYTAHSMQDAFRVEVFKSQEDLFSKILGDVLFETPIFTKATSHGTARNILKETLTDIRSEYLADKITYMLRKFGVSSNPRYWTMFG